MWGFPPVADQAEEWLAFLWGAERVRVNRAGSLFRFPVCTSPAPRH